MKKKIELKVGQIWQKPKTLDVRTIQGLYKRRVGKSILYFYVEYVDIGGTFNRLDRQEFLDWARSAKEVGCYNSRRKAVLAK